MSTRLTWCCFAFVLALALGYVEEAARARARALDQMSVVPVGADRAILGRNRLVPATAYDGLFWISYAQQLAATGEWRIRRTNIDNAPYGREVHWSSGFALWLVALGHVRQAFTHEPLVQAIEYAAAYANPLLMMMALVLLGGVGARRYGPAVGLLLVAMLASLPAIIDSFAVNEPDHHGLINVASLGTVLGLLAGGLGWERRDALELRGLLPGAGRARTWFLFSAWCGAAGMWISAATQILVFVGVGIGAAVAILLGGKGEADGSTVPRPELWRTWGRWGAALSLGFYVLEYFPSHLAMRLEVNHPIHAAAWWGAGELLATLAAWRQTGAPLWPRAVRRQLGLVAAFLALLAPLGAISIGGVAWFRMLDPLFGVLPSLVIEGESLLADIRHAANYWIVARDLAAVVVLLLLGLSAVAARRLTRVERSLALAMVLMVAPMIVAAWLQNRWLLVVSGMSPVFAVTGLFAWRPHFSPKAGALALAGFIVALAAVFPRYYAGRTFAIATATRINLTEDDAFVISMRHYAQELRAKVGPNAHPIVVAGPNESALLAYYGGIRTVGTLYWENLDGLKDAAAIYGTSDLAKVKALFAARGVTHLFSCPPGNFAIGYSALASGTLDRARTQRSFSALLFIAGKFPSWMQPVWLSPPGVVLNPPPVRCFAFAPDQTEAEQLEHIARYQREATAGAAKP